MMTFVSRSVRPFDVLGVRDPELESADRGSDDLTIDLDHGEPGAARVIDDLGEPVTCVIPPGFLGALVAIVHDAQGAHVI